MLRKLIMFAITSGLAKKAWDHYRSRPAADARTPAAPRTRSTVTPMSAARPSATAAGTGQAGASNAPDPAAHTRATTAGVGSV